MCNCGNKRNQLQLPTQQPMRSQQPLPQAGEKTGPPITFMYTGKTALTVTGTVTGKQYRFTHPGDRQLVDAGDAPSMTLVPVVQRMQEQA